MHDNDVKTGNNGLIEPECCFGPACRFSEHVQCLCLHVHSVLLHSWFDFRVLFAISCLAADIQFNPGRPGPWCHPWHPMLSTIQPTSYSCLSLSFHPQRQPFACYPEGSGPLGVKQSPPPPLLPLLPALLALRRPRPQARNGHSLCREF